MFSLLQISNNLIKGSVQNVEVSDILVTKLEISLFLWTFLFGETVS